MVIVEVDQGENNGVTIGLLVGRRLLVYDLHSLSIAISHLHQ